MTKCQITITRFAAWVVPKSDHPSTCLDSNAQPLNHPICSLGSPQVKSHPNAFGFRVPNRWFTRFAAWVVPNSDHPNGFGFRVPNCWFTRFAAWVVPKSDHPSTCFDSNAKPLNHSICSLGSPQVRSPLNAFGFKCQAVEPPDLQLG